MNTLRRRMLLGAGLGALLMLATPALLTGCTAAQPKPFVAGREVLPPTGCRYLRAENPDGAC